MDFKELGKLAGAYNSSRVLHVACNLKIFDILASGSRTDQGIAEAIGAKPRSTGLLCNALTGLGLLEKSAGKYTNTGLAQNYLVTSSPNYYGWVVKHNAKLWDGWAKLEESVISGRPIERPGAPERDEEDQEAFIMGMHSIIIAGGDAELMAEHLNLSECKKILDLGGGPGTFSVVFCEQNPQLKAVLFDLPETIKIARKNVARYSSVADRVEFYEGDFFRGDLPSGFDMVFISNIIHMNNEEENAMLMKRVYEALNDGGRIVVKDFIMNKDLTKPAEGAVFALNMLLHTNGRDYSADEIERWFKAAGFTGTTLLEDLPNETPYGVIIAAK